MGQIREQNHIIISVKICDFMAFSLLDLTVLLNDVNFLYQVAMLWLLQPNFVAVLDMFFLIKLA